MVLNILVLTLALLLGSLKVSASETPTEPQVMSLQDYKAYYDYTQEVEAKKRERNLIVGILFVIVGIIFLVALKQLGVIEL